MRAEILLAGLLVLAPACTLHTALPIERRLPGLGGPGGVAWAPVDSEAGEPWRPAVPSDLEGSFESVDIRGTAAATLLEMHYRFERDGHYTGAAVIRCDGRTRHQEVAGEWQLRDGMLSLGNGSPPATARVRDRRLELSTALGTVLLARG